MADELKRNNHYNPQFLLKKFADSNGQIRAWDGKKVKTVGANSIMAGDWIYTVYSPQWVANNDLEDLLSKFESIAGLALNEILSTRQLTEDTFSVLTEFIALQAVRHPDAIKRHHQLIKDVTAIFALAPSVTEYEFAEAVKKYGIESVDASEIYFTLKDRDPDLLLATHDYVDGLHLQQSQEIPLSDFLNAINPIADQLYKMPARLIEAPKGEYFVLGDTPVPKVERDNTFVFPLSKDLAIHFYSASIGPAFAPNYVANTSEMKAINMDQWAKAKDIVIGPDQTALKLLK